MGFTDGRMRITGLGVVQFAVATFSTTDTTVTLNCKGFRKIRPLGPPIALAAPNANDVLGIGGSTAVDAAGIVTVDTDGTITIERPASGTSGLVVGMAFVGEG